MSRAIHAPQNLNLLPGGRPRREVGDWPAAPWRGHGDGPPAPRRVHGDGPTAPLRGTATGPRLSGWRTTMGPRLSGGRTATAAYFLVFSKNSIQQVSSICVVLVMSYSFARLEMLVFLLVCLLVLGWSI
jgi:hypothetical protein